MIPQETNFSFLERFDSRVAQLAKQAEEYVHTDPDSCMFKLRLMVETMAKKLTKLQLRSDISQDLGSMLGALERNGIVPRRQADSMHAIRRDGNAAVHGNSTPVPTAMRRLKEAYKISEWFCPRRARMMIFRGSTAVIIIIFMEENIRGNKRMRQKMSATKNVCCPRTQTHARGRKRMRTSQQKRS